MWPSLPDGRRLCLNIYAIGLALIHSSALTGNTLSLREACCINNRSAVKVRMLTEEAHQNGHPLVFMDAEEMRASVDDHPHIHVSMESLKFAHPPVDPLYYENKDIYQALLFCRAGEEAPYVRNYPEFRFVRWHDVSTDVLPAGGSKAEGIRLMIEKLGIDKEDVYAFGDGLNDIEMLSFVGTGVAMGNAHEEVKRVADFVTKPVDEEGIWHGLKQLQLLP